MLSRDIFNMLFTNIVCLGIGKFSKIMMQITIITYTFLSKAKKQEKLVSFSIKL